MNTPETTKTKELAQLANAFSDACQKAAEQGKTASHAAPVVMAALAVLTVVQPNFGW